MTYDYKEGLNIFSTECVLEGLWNKEELIRQHVDHVNDQFCKRTVSNWDWSVADVLQKPNYFL